MKTFSREIVTGYKYKNFHTENTMFFVYFMRILELGKKNNKIKIILYL